MCFIRYSLSVAAYTALACVAAAAQTVLVSGVVAAGSHEPVSHVNVQIEHAGSDSTTESGEFTIRLPLEPRFKIGMLMTLQVKGWVIKSPYLYERGQTYIPAPEAPPIPVQVFRQGNASLLDRKGIQSMLQGHYSRIAPNRAAAEGPRSRIDDIENSFLAMAYAELMIAPMTRIPTNTAPCAWEIPASEHVGLVQSTESLRSTATPGAGSIRLLASARLNGPEYSYGQAKRTPRASGVALTRILENRSVAVTENPRESVAREESDTTPDDSNPEWQRFLAKQAKELGFSVEQVATVINEWTKSAEDPYQKGLAALRDGRYAEASTYISESIPSPPGEFVERYVPLAYADFEQGHYGAAEAALRKALAVHPDDPVLLNNLGVVLVREGKYGEGEAEQLYKKAQSIDELELGPEHPDVAANLGNLAELYRLEERYKEAEPLYRRALDIDEKVLGPLDPRAATDLNNLALLFQAQGKNDKAIFVYQMVMAIDEKQATNEEPEDRAATLSNLAEAYRVQQMYPEAEPLYEQGIALVQSRLGAKHPMMAVFLNDKGLLYHAQGRDDEAQQLYKRALEIDKSALGPDHPWVALTLDNLGELYRTQKKYPDAEPLYQQALAIAEKKESESLQMAKYLNHLAVLYHEQGKLTQAEPLYKHALEIDERHMDSDDPDLAVALGNLGLVYKDERKYTEAEPVLKRALAIQNKVLTSDDQALFFTLVNLAATLVHLDRVSEAKVYAEQSERILVDRRAAKAHEQGNDAEAESLFKQALTSAEVSLGREHPEVARELSNLATVYAAQGKDAEALPLLERALSIEVKTQGPQDLHVATIDENMAAVLRKLGRDAEAKVYDDRAAKIRANSDKEP
jgi:tetratricopeptide (TPR) repeat protein